MRFFSLSILLVISLPLYAFQLQPGDLLFQDIECGHLCNAIFTVTHRYNSTDISHVAMVVETKPKVIVIEAIGKDVHLTPLKTFLHRWHSVDQHGHPRVMVGRLKKPYHSLIPKAIQAARSWLGRPYNVDFTPNNLQAHHQSFYCSQLIYDAFEKANHGHPIFAQDHMSFDNPKTQQFYTGWDTYFQALHRSIPQGKLGTNPGEMSRSPDLHILCRYGHLKQQKATSLSIPLCQLVPKHQKGQTQ